MRIGIVCLPERGGYYATFAVAKALARTGHDLVYFGPVDFEAEVVRQGFAFVTVFQEAFGKDECDLPPALESWWARIAATVRVLRASVDRPDRWALIEALADRQLAGLTKRERLDLLLVDGLFQEVVPQLAASGVPVRLFGTELSSGSRSLPPSFSGTIPRAGMGGRWAIRIAWWKCRAAHLWRSIGWQATVLLLRLLAWNVDLTPPRELVRRVSRVRREDMERAGLRESSWEYGRSSGLPDVFLCCRDFDFPGVEQERVYLGPCIDLARAEPAFPWERIDPARKLVYVSLGTHAGRYTRRTLPFLRKVVEVAAAMPALQFVLVLGKGRDAKALGELPGNVVAVRFAPQLALLARASVALTNGGLGTLKECIWFGVPTIVAPCRWDQPGNAARVVFHRLGLRVDTRRVGTTELRAAIEECLESQDIQQAVAHMAERFRVSSEELSTKIDWLLAGRRARRGLEPKPYLPKRYVEN